MGNLFSVKTNIKSSGAKDEAVRVTCTVKGIPISDYRQLKPGDTIATNSGTMWGVVHVGIYIGSGPKEDRPEVIDFTDDSKVNRVHMNDFRREGSSSSSSYSTSKKGGKGYSSPSGDESLRPLFRFSYTDAPQAYTPEEIVKRAHLKSKNQDFEAYDAIFNNCEHFVTYCTFGKRFSCQVADKIKTGEYCRVVDGM